MTQITSVIFLFLAAAQAHAFHPSMDFSNGFVQLTTASVIKASSAPAPQVKQVPVSTPTPAPAPQIEDVPHEPYPAPAESQQESSSEVVGGNSNIEITSDSAPMSSSLRPKARPSKTAKKETTVQPEATPAKTAPSVYDMRDCKYARESGSNSKCYKSMSTVDRAKRIMTAANYVNKLHKTQFDGRYMLCTGYRESNFNPGAKGADGERGMFQVMKGTGKGALKYGVELAEFKGLDSETYMTKMSNSTVAQVELSFLVLKMMLTEDSAKGGAAKSRQTRIMSGQGTVEDYRRLAGRYNGGGYSSTYAKRISSCYNCMTGKIAANSTKIDSGIQSCLNKAK